ncbi:MAG TPA: phosphatidate cytidylyltransferase, partial [Fibrobacteraceae bacterium]|nr:phosphatidate cytidylyltransferase [Fibrobacteraceae bacterium]
MSNLAQRLIFAAVAIPVVFFCLWWADWTRISLMVFLGAVGAWEWSRMVSKIYSGPSMQIFAPLSAAALTLG